MQILVITMVSKSEVIIAIGAHPDDIELGCGGTLFKSSQMGKHVVAVFLTRGEKSGDAAVRANESTEALRVLGVTDVHFLNFPDTEVPGSFEAIDSLEKFEVKYNPDMVLTHTINDTHQDHRQVGWLTLGCVQECLEDTCLRDSEGAAWAFLSGVFC